MDTKMNGGEIVPEREYIPATAHEWESLYKDSKALIIGRLAKAGYCYDVAEDGFEDAFLKTMGLSATRHINGDLTPKTFSHWKNWLYLQAKSIVQDACRKNSAWYEQSKEQVTCCTDERCDDRISDEARFKDEMFEAQNLEDENARKTRRLERYRVAQEENAAGRNIECDYVESQDLVKRWVRKVLANSGTDKLTARGYCHQMFDGWTAEQVARRVYSLSDPEMIKTKSASIRKARERCNQKLRLKYETDGEMKNFLMAA